MNKIVFEHYPVSKLPEELRHGLGSEASVRIVIEEQAVPALASESGFSDLRRPDAAPLDVAELKARIAAYRRLHPEGTTVEEAVSRIRTLRDEWEEE